MVLTNELIDKIKDMIVMSDNKCVLTCTENDEVILNYLGRGLLLTGDDIGEVIHGCKLKHDDDSDVLKIIDKECMTLMRRRYQMYKSTFGRVPSFSNLMNKDTMIGNLLGIKVSKANTMDGIFKTGYNFIDKDINDLDINDTYTVRISVKSGVFKLSLIGKKEYPVFVGMAKHGDITIDNVNIALFKPLLFDKLYSIIKSRDLLFYAGTSSYRLASSVEKDIRNLSEGAMLITQDGSINSNNEELYFRYIDNAITIYRLDGNNYILCYVIADKFINIPYRTLPSTMSLPTLYIGGEFDKDNEILEKINSDMPRHNYYNRITDIPKRLITNKTLPIFVSNIKRDGNGELMDKLKDKLSNELLEQFKKLTGE